MFTELQINLGDPRLAMTLNDHGHMPINLGQRYILYPYFDKSIGCIVPLDFPIESVNGDDRFYFSKNKLNDAKFIKFPFQTDSPLPENLYNACIEECVRILHKSKKN